MPKHPQSKLGYMEDGVMTLKIRHPLASPDKTTQRKSTSRKTTSTTAIKSKTNFTHYTDVITKEKFKFKPEETKRVVKVGDMKSLNILCDILASILDKFKNSHHINSNDHKNLTMRKFNSHRKVLFDTVRTLFCVCDRNHYRSPLYYASLCGHYEIVDFLCATLFLGLVCNERNWNKYVAYPPAVNPNSKEGEYSIFSELTFRTHVENLGCWNGGIDSLAFDCCYISALNLEIRNILDGKSWTYDKARKKYQDFITRNNKFQRTWYQTVAPRLSQTLEAIDCVDLKKVRSLKNREKVLLANAEKKKKPKIVEIDDEFDPFDTGWREKTNAYTIEFEDNDGMYDAYGNGYYSDGEYECEQDENDGFETYDPRLWEQGELKNNDSDSDAASDNGSFSTFQSMGETSSNASNFTQTFDIVSQSSSSVNGDCGWEFIEDEIDNGAMSLDSDASVVSTTVIESITTADRKDDVATKKSWADIAAAAASKNVVPPLSPLQALINPTAAASPINSKSKNITPALESTAPSTNAQGEFWFDAERDAAKSQYGGKSLVHQLKGNQRSQSNRGRGSDIGFRKVNKEFRNECVRIRKGVTV